MAEAGQGSLLFPGRVGVCISYAFACSGLPAGRRLRLGSGRKWSREGENRGENDVSKTKFRKPA